MRTLLTFIFISLVIGAAIGFELPRTWQREARREFESRPGNSLYETLGCILPHEYWQTDPIGNCFANLSTILRSEMDVACDTFMEKTGCVHRKDIKKLDSRQLYVESGLSEEYDKHLQLVGRLLYQGNYRQAQKEADEALDIRCNSQFHLAQQEEFFADNLVSIGEYSAAKEILLSLTPVDRSTGECGFAPACRAPIVAYRQFLLGEAYIGLGNARSAIDLLKTDVPNLIKESSMRVALAWALSHAYLLAGDNEKAVQTFDAYYFSTDQKGRHFFSELAQLDEVNHKLAEHIVGESLDRCRENGRLGSPDCLQELQLVARLLKIRGHALLAKQMELRAGEVECQTNW